MDTILVASSSLTLECRASLNGPNTAYSVADHSAAAVSQAGTPHLTVSTHYDASARTFTVKTKQHTPPSPGQATKRPVLIPLAVGLLGPDGKDMPLTLQVAKTSDLVGNGCKYKGLGKLGGQSNMQYPYTMYSLFDSCIRRAVPRRWAPPPCCASKPGIAS